MQARKPPLLFGSGGQTVEKPLTGFSDKFLQSAARTICAPAAHKFYTPQPEKYFLSGTRPDRK